METKLYIAVIFLVLFSSNMFSQSSELEDKERKNDIELTTFQGFTSDFGLSYNFFVGPDAEDFRTSINGFGSGFLLDLYSARISWNVLTYGTEKVNLSLGAGLGLSSYRFAENLIIQNEDGIVTWSKDEDPSHDYGNGFFSYGKSKLVSTTFAVPVNMNFHTKKFFFTAGATYDLFLSGKLKRKFREDGRKQKVVTKNETFNDFPINRHKLGFAAAIKHKPSGINIGATYMMTPFFEEGKGPDISEMRISVSYCFPSFKKNKKWELDF